RWHGFFTARWHRRPFEDAVRSPLTTPPASARRSAGEPFPPSAHGHRLRSLATGGGLQMAHQAGLEIPCRHSPTSVAGALHIQSGGGSWSASVARFGRGCCGTGVVFITVAFHYALTGSASQSPPV